MDSRTIAEKRTCFANAASVAYADGRIDPSEAVVLAKIATTLQLPLAEFKRITAGDFP